MQSTVALEESPPLSVIGKQGLKASSEIDLSGAGSIRGFHFRFVGADGKQAKRKKHTPPFALNSRAEG